MSHERERVCFVWHERERARARETWREKVSTKKLAAMQPARKYCTLEL
jgi:hypothetical protein